MRDALSSVPEHRPISTFLPRIFKFTSTLYGSKPLRLEDSRQIVESTAIGRSAAKLPAAATDLVSVQSARSASQRISKPMSWRVRLACSLLSMCMATAARPRGWTISGYA